LIAAAQLVPLPRTPSVSTILLDYVNDCKAASDADPTCVAFFSTP
jgi:hypothetical protein